MDKVLNKVIYFLPNTAYVVLPKPSNVWGRYGPLANFPPSFKLKPARNKSINIMSNKLYSIFQLLYFFIKDKK